MQGKNTILEKSNFVDQIRVFCRSGHGGAGIKHFRRDKLTAYGGPDGGDGGRGGHIILKGNRNLWTLLHLRYHKNVLAEDGDRGRDNNQTGKNGNDILLEVPLGTIAYDEEQMTVEEWQKCLANRQLKIADYIKAEKDRAMMKAQAQGQINTAPAQGANNNGFGGFTAATPAGGFNF